MNIFSLIPGNFFSILASRNREIYFDALMLLNEKLREELNIPVSEYIASLAGLIEDRNFVVEKEDETPDVPDAVEGQSALNSHTKARLILARLVNTGWVDRETTDGSFTEIITPRDYAIRMMQLLDEMRDGGIHEYNSLVFSTYSALKQAAQLKQAAYEQARVSYEAVLAAKRNTETLMYELHHPDGIVPGGDDFDKRAVRILPVNPSGLHDPGQDKPGLGMGIKRPLPCHGIGYIGTLVLFFNDKIPVFDEGRQGGDIITHRDVEVLFEVILQQHEGVKINFPVS